MLSDKRLPKVSSQQTKHRWQSRAQGIGNFFLIWLGLCWVYPFSSEVLQEIGKTYETRNHYSYLLTLWHLFLLILWYTNPWHVLPDGLSHCWLQVIYIIFIERNQTLIHLHVDDDRLRQSGLQTVGLAQLNLIWRVAFGWDMIACSN